MWWRPFLLFVHWSLCTGAVDAFGVTSTTTTPTTTTSTTTPTISCSKKKGRSSRCSSSRCRSRSHWKKRYHGSILFPIEGSAMSPTMAISAASSDDDEHRNDSSSPIESVKEGDSNNDNDPASLFLDKDNNQGNSRSNSNSNNNKSTNNVNNRPYLQVAQDEVVGIGGKKGYTYDVNKLKLNLVQKSVRQFKQELLSLLISSSSSSSSSWSRRSAKGRSKQSIQQRLKIEEKLAALISANPVATTTDSNLLEGTWELAFVTENAVEILDDARFVYSRKKPTLFANNADSEEKDVDKKKRIGGDTIQSGWKLSTASQGTLENPLHTVTRSIHLEDLDQDEDPFMVDCVSLFRGLWTVQRFYNIVGLSRTNLQLIPSKKIISFCGRDISGTTVEKEDGLTMKLQFIYLDSDICISMTAGNANDLQVYTKNEEWIESRRQKKHIIKKTLAWLNKFGTPFKLRKKLFALVGQNGTELDDSSAGNRLGMEEGPLGKLTEEEYQILLRIVYDDKVSKLTALRLGDYGDGSKDDESAWGGKDDPFVHLTADERQSIMKQMSIGEIKKAGYIQRKFAEKNKRRRSSIQKFKRPLYEEGQG